MSTAAANTSLDSGESVTGTLASKWKPPQGLAIPNRDRLFLTLLDATAPEESLVGSVLFDIRRFPLLRRVLTFFMLQGWVLGDLSVREFRLFRLFLLIPCWESQRLIPKRSAGPRAIEIGVVSLKALDHHRPNREKSAILPLNYPPPVRKPRTAVTMPRGAIR